MTDETHAMDAAVVIEFLDGILPFKDLDADSKRRLAPQCIIDFFPKGTMIFRQDVTEVKHLYLIQQGGVKSYLKDADGEITLMDYRGEGEYFGALPIIQGTKANLNVETVEDTFCFLIHQNVFQEMLHKNPEVAQYFLRTMSAKLVKGVYTELRQLKMSPRREGALYLFSARVEDMAKGKLYTASVDTSVREVARLMTENRIGSLLLKDGDGNIVGIVTDKDLRGKVVAQGMDYSTRVAEIMTSPVQKISCNAICFDALLKMMKSRIHHLAIEKRGEIFRMITTHDIMVAQGTSPLYLFREIVAQRQIGGLYSLAQRISSVIRTLIEEGAKAHNITRMITVLNDHILERLLTLLIEEMGEPPVPFCWLMIGSEGRSEQTFKTDQDNAIIYSDIDDPGLAAEAEAYFTRFAAAAIGHLVRCGYPLCPGEIMASNPKWRQPLAKWKAYFRDWCMTPTPDRVLNSTIFFDFRAGFGAQHLADELWGYLMELTRRADLFLLHLAKNCLATRPPLSFFRNFIVEKDGEHKNTFDLKTKGLVFFADFARLLALKFGVEETNTLGRLQLLQENHYLPEALCTEIIEAYEFIMQLRLVHQLRLLEDGREPDNHIDPLDISDLERQTLKEAFAVIRRLQEFLRQEFHLNE